MYWTNSGLDFATRNVLISYNIITIWCIWIMWFATVDVWVDSSTSPLLRLLWNFPPTFTSIWHKHHEYLFYFYKILPHYNRNLTWKLRRHSMPWESSVNRLCDKYDDWLNFLYKRIDKIFDLVKMWILYDTQKRPRN